ncbi:MAG: corrinoid ABC transporter permease [Nitrospirales bacterium]|nr:MAG: corrinoid ABC transporter permease [Nitrospirales bacterium]
MKPTLEIPPLPSSQSSVDVAAPVRPEVHRKPVVSNFRSLTLHRWCVWVSAFLVFAMLALMVCLRYGTQVIELPRIFNILVQAMTAVSQGGSGEDPTHVILLQVRLPRLLLAFLVGASLAAVGVSLQALLRNPLADPFVLGISSGAALGAAIALLFGVGVSMWSLSALPMCAFLGAIISLLIIYRIAATQYGFSIYTLLLAGVVLSAVLMALITFLTSVADPNRVFGMLAWLMGSLTGPDYPTLGILAVYLGIGLLILGSQAQSLNVLTLGEEAARSLGVEVERVKKLVFFATALVTGAVVAFSGLIGFVGLIVPHAVRLALGADHRLLLPIAGLTGGIFLMVADTVARTLFSPAEIPVGVVTAIVGGPVFLYLLMNRRAQVVT